VLKCRVIQFINLERNLFISNAYAQSAAGPGVLDGLMSSAPMIIMMVAVFFFLILRPQMKRQKELKELMDALAKGDEVVTTGGILGTVTKVTEAYVIVEIANGTTVVLQKAAVTMLLPKGTIKAI
jgi:preprotein translocase subunit YajC